MKETLYTIMKNKSSLHPGADSSSHLINISFLTRGLSGLIKGKRSWKPHATVQGFMFKRIYLEKSEGRRLLLLSLISL